MHDAYKGRKTQFASIDSRVLKISRSVCIIDAKAFLLMISLIICTCMHFFSIFVVYVLTKSRSGKSTPGTM